MRTCARIAGLLLWGASAVAAGPGWQQVAATVELLPGRLVPGQQPDGNSVLYAAPEGWVLLDSGRHLDHTRALAARIAASGRPLKVLLNSHWHLDHIAGNPLLRRRFPGVQVLGGDAVHAALAPGGFLANYRGQLEQELARPDLPAATRAQYTAEVARIDAGPALTPDEVIHGSGSRMLAGHRFEVQLETRAVSGSDVWLFDSSSGVLAAGDLVTFPAPFLDTACAARWQQALGRIERTPFRQLIPGHGPVLDPAGFRRWRQAFDSLLACAAQPAVATRVCAAAWIRNLGPLLPVAEHPYTQSMLGYYIEQILRGPAAQQHCGAD